MSYSNNIIALIVISLIVSVGMFILTFFITFNVACLISPPCVVDDNGEKHGVMAMGQAFLGIILGIIGGILSLIVCYRKLKRKWK